MILIYFIYFKIVNTSKAGSGKITSKIVNNKQIQVLVKNNKAQDHEYEISFTPLQPGLHRCSVYFNNKEIKGKIQT